MQSFQVTLNVSNGANTSAHYGFILDAWSLDDACDRACSAAQLCDLLVLSVAAEALEHAKQ